MLTPLSTYTDFSAQSTTSAGAGGTNTGAGNQGWVDWAGNIANIVSGTYLGNTQNVLKLTTANGGGFTNQIIVRPTASEKKLNGMVTFTLPAGAPAAGVNLSAMARFDGSNDTFYFVQVAGNGSLNIYRLVAGSPTLIFAGYGNGSGLTYTTGDPLRYDIHFTGVNPTTISWQAYDPSSAGTPTGGLIFSGSFNDTGDSSMRSAGVFGLDVWGTGNTTVVNLGVAYYPDNAIIANQVTVTSTKTAITLVALAPPGFNGSMSYQWYRSTTSGFTPGAGNLIAGKTSLTFVDSTASPGTTYYYQLLGTDSSNQVATYQEVAAQLSNGSIGLAFIGDSIYGTTTGVVNTAAAAVASLGNVNVTSYNFGVAGTGTASWVAAIGNGLTFTNDMATATAAGVANYSVMLGTNDCSDALAVSAATYAANMATIVNYVKTQCAAASIVPKIFLHLPPWTTPGSFANGRTWSEAGMTLLASYQAKLDALVDGVNVFKGDRQAMTLFSMNSGVYPLASGFSGWSYDGVHPNSTGATQLGNLQAAAIVSAMGIGTAGGGSGGGLQNGLRTRAR